MAHDGGIPIDQAKRSLDQPIVEILKIPLGVVLLHVFLHHVVQMRLSLWSDLDQALRLDRTNEELRVGIQIETSRGKLHDLDA